ncbi:golgin subfamily A member 4-like [Neodiprion fabricii]|uniref:golgin subfamily A member 4-like n=1 Tax=Neodiprion fabricii TaxID=2872261 RepID=UPI001ED96537|nr:golgin subfamily A member 4-like [Neodiprion fabricii]
MSGECGLHPDFTMTSSQAVAIAASATLGRLNLLMRQVTDWQDERLALESKVMRLKSALQSLGGNVDETLKLDPVVVRQREEIGRLRLSEDRLGEEIRRLRVALVEAEEAITCSGAKRLKDKMARVRAAGAEERRRLSEEIEYLKTRVREAEEDSSCSALGRLRSKLREILNGDKIVERFIADVATRGCVTVVDLLGEATRVKETLDQSIVENIWLRADNRRLTAALESATETGCSGYLETIERLGFRVKELERRNKELEDDSQLVKRLGELEDELNIKRIELDDREASINALRNELLGAKTAYEIKAGELADIEFDKGELRRVNEEREQLEQRIGELQERIEKADFIARDAEAVRNELNRVKSEVLSLEIERDALIEDIEQMRNIISDRNEQIARILEDNEQRDKARKSEIEGVRTKLRIALAEKKNLVSGCGNVEDEKTGRIGEASGDSKPLGKKIRALEGELVKLKELSMDPLIKNLGSTVRLERELAVERSTKESVIKESESLKVENGCLRCEKNELEVKLEEFRAQTTEFRNELVRLVEKNQQLVMEVDELKGIAENEMRLKKKLVIMQDDNEQLKKDMHGLKSNDSVEIRIQQLDTELRKLKTEREALKTEYKKLVSANETLKIKLTDRKTRNDELEERLKVNSRDCDALREKLAVVEDDLDEAKEEIGSLRTSADLVKGEFDDLKARNEVLVAEVKKLHAEAEEASKKEEESIRTKEWDKGTVVMDCGDYVRADREMKYFIHLQSLAVKRVADFISYVEGQTSLRPAMATFLEPTFTNVMILNVDENVRTTFRMSQKLSETIFNAEISVQRLETLRNEADHLRKERDCLNNGMEKLNSMLSKLGQNVLMQSPDHRHVEFCTASGTDMDQCWSKSRNNIPRVMVSSQSCQNSEDQVYYPTFETEVLSDYTGEKFCTMNNRISDLQREIKAKQQEAAERLIEMRETMRQERMRLMEIADRGSSSGVHSPAPSIILEEISHQNESTNTLTGLKQPSVVQRNANVLCTSETADVIGKAGNSPQPFSSRMDSPFINHIDPLDLVSGISDSW